jgi:hypothetical protein
MRKGQRKLEVWVPENHPIFNAEYLGKRSKIVRELLDSYCKELVTPSPPPPSLQSETDQSDPVNL